MGQGQAKAQGVACRGCTLYLIRTCYEHNWWFHLFREPLVLGMRLLAWFHGIEVARQSVKLQSCDGCVRFMKAKLTERSPTFRFLNNLIGKKFNQLRDSMLSQEEIEEGKRLAKEASKGTL